jgi:hypothetical protein
VADVNVGKLKLNVAAPAGHEHRFAPIANRAAGLFATGVQQRFGEAARDVRIDTIQGAPLSIDWNVTTDEEAASRIADAWLGSIATGLGEA